MHRKQDIGIQITIHEARGYKAIMGLQKVEENLYFIQLPFLQEELLFLQKGIIGVFQRKILKMPEKRDGFILVRMEMECR